MGEERREDAVQRLLADVHEDRRFRLADGNHVRNLRELDRALDDMRDEVFRHHVNDEKNDFSRWARDVKG